MRKMRAFFILLILNAGFLSANSQKGIAKFSNNSKEPANNLHFINDISIKGSSEAVSVDLYPEVEIASSNLLISHSKGKYLMASEVIESANKLQAKYAMLLDVNIESIKNWRLFNFIEDWYGTGYRYGGTTKKGIDCSAFTASLLLAAYGFNAPRTARDQYQTSARTKRENLHEGDLVFFNTTGGISHVGVYLANNYFVHSSSSQGVMVSTLDDPYYKKRYLGGGKVSTTSLQ